MMSEMSMTVLLVFVLVAFVAGYVDAIAGGGGMLNLPTLLFFGVPAVSALAINKIAGVAGTSLAVLKYASKKQIDWQLVLWGIVPCFFASYLGGKFALGMSETLLNMLILFCIPIALWVVLKDNNTAEKNSKPATRNKIWLAVVPIGFYDGLLGPGTGSYMAIAVRKILHFDYVSATASIKPLNLVTNLGAVLVFLMADKILWQIALPMAVSSALGGWVGGRFAIANGAVFIRKLLVLVLVCMLILNLIKILY